MPPAPRRPGAAVKGPAGRSASRLDGASVLGITLGWGAFLAAVLWEGGFASLRAFWNPPAFVLVVGGTLGATVLSYPGERLRTLPGVLRRAFLLPDGSAVQGSGDDRPALVAILVNLAEKARREGLLSLEDDARPAPSAASRPRWA